MGVIRPAIVPAIATGADHAWKPLNTKRWAHLHQTGPGYVSMLSIKAQPDVTARPAKRSAKK